MGSEQGHLFCKECIYKYLLTKKKEYEEQMDAYQQMIQDEEVFSCLFHDWIARNPRAYENRRGADLWRYRANAVCCSKRPQACKPHSDAEHEMYVNSVETKEDKEFKEMKRVVDKLSCNYDNRTAEEKSLAMNFWIPENTPEYKERLKMVTCSSSLFL